MKTLIAALALLTAAPTLADSVVVNGNTTGGPTYNRTLAGTPPSVLSLVGTAVRYQTTAFTVSAAGSYSLTSVATTPQYDPFLTLYAGSFNPASALSNALIANDDATAGDFSTSAFTINLLAGTSYFAVQSGFDNLDFGAYTLTIAGPGTVSIGGGAVPEPATWALMVGGFGLVGGVMRRRAPASVTA